MSLFSRKKRTVMIPITVKCTNCNHDVVVGHHVIEVAAKIKKNVINTAKTVDITNFNNDELACKNADDRYDSDHSTNQGIANGGYVFVHFSQPVHVHSINLIDVENKVNQQGSIGFYNQTTNLLADAAQPMLAMQYDNMDEDGSDWGIMDFSNQDGFDYSTLSITTLVVRMQGSNGFDDIAFSAAEVSAPGTLAIFALGLFCKMPLPTACNKCVLPKPVPP